MGMLNLLLVGYCSVLVEEFRIAVAIVTANFIMEDLLLIEEHNTILIIVVGVIQKKTKNWWLILMNVDSLESELEQCMWQQFDCSQLFLVVIAKANSAGEFVVTQFTKDLMEAFHLLLKDWFTKK